jgi:hypothetical protein
VPLSSLAGTAAPSGYVRDASGQLVPALTREAGLAAGNAAAANPAYQAANKVGSSIATATNVASSLATQTSGLLSIVSSLKSSVTSNKGSSTSSGNNANNTGGTGSAAGGGNQNAASNTGATNTVSTAAGGNGAAGTGTAGTTSGAGGAVGAALNPDTLSRAEKEKIEKLKKEYMNLKDKATAARNNLESNEIKVKDLEELLKKSDKDAQNLTGKAKIKAQSSANGIKKQLSALETKNNKLAEIYKAAQKAADTAEKAYNDAVNAAAAAQQH